MQEVESELEPHRLHVSALQGGGDVHVHVEEPAVTAVSAVAALVSALPTCSSLLHAQPARFLAGREVSQTIQNFSGHG